jgi:hypothetical protein
LNKRIYTALEFQSENEEVGNLLQPSNHLLHQYKATPVTLTDIAIEAVTPHLPKDTLKRTRLAEYGSWLLQEMISRSQASPAQIQPELSYATSLINPADVTIIRPHQAVYFFVIRGGNLKKDMQTRMIYMIHVVVEIHKGSLLVYRGRNQYYGSMSIASSN